MQMPVEALLLANNTKNDQAISSDGELWYPMAFRFPKFKQNINSRYVKSLTKCNCNRSRPEKKFQVTIFNYKDPISS